MIRSKHVGHFAAGEAITWDARISYWHASLSPGSLLPAQLPANTPKRQIMGQLFGFLPPTGEIWSLGLLVLAYPTCLFTGI